MASVVVQGQKIVNICLRRNICLGQRCLKSFMCNTVTWKSPSMYRGCLYFVPKTIPEQKCQFLHQHVYNSDLSDSEKAEKKSRKKEKRVVRKTVPGFDDTVQFFSEVDELLKQWETDNVPISVNIWESLPDKFHKLDNSPLLEFDASVMEKIARRHPPEFAITFMEFIRKRKVPSLGAFTSLVSSCGEKYPEVVFREYQELLKHYSVIDLGNYRNLIRGFSKTSEWKKSLEFLEQIKQIGVKSDFPPGITDVVEAAVAHNDADTLEHLIASASEQSPLPELLSQGVFNAWSSGRIDIQIFLKLLSEKKGCLTLPQAEQLDNRIKREMGNGYQCHWGKIISGRCNVCGDLLRGQSVSDSQVKLLGERLNSHIASSKHIYVYSKPEEYLHFSKWLVKEGPFDIVIDAANVYYCWVAPGKKDQKRNQEHRLEKLLEPFEKVLFVCNNRKIINYLKMKFGFNKRFHLYRPESSSDDDAFMLIAAFHCGPDCYIVSGDNFRSLKDSIGRDVIPVFEHWQRRRQIFPFRSSQPPLMPQQYDFCVQEHSSGWHIPYVPAERLTAWRKTVQNYGFYMPDTLICLKSTR